MGSRHRRDGSVCVVGMRGRQQGGRDALVCSRSMHGPEASAFARGGWREQGQESKEERAEGKGKGNTGRGFKGLACQLGIDKTEK